MSNFKYLIVGVQDYTRDMTKEDVIYVYQFSNLISCFVMGFDYNCKENCPCQSKNRLKNMMNLSIVRDYVAFTDYYYGTDYFEKLKKLGISK